MSLTSKAPNPGKGVRYLGLLDQALCNGSWAEIAELARKVDKHAPNRKCLTLTARSEAQIASASHRPTSASSTVTSSIHGLSEFAPKLSEAAAVGNSIEEDAFAAKTCLAEIHWLQEDHTAALKALPQHAPQVNDSASHPALGWLEVCGVKASFIKASALVAIGRRDEARSLYQAAVSQTTGSRTPELRRWTERLLSRACMYDRRWRLEPSMQRLSEGYRAFSAWSDFWQRATPSGSGTTPSQIDVPRRQIWRAYYDLLSTVLRYGLIYNPSPTASDHLLLSPSTALSDEEYTIAKQQQRAELKRVEITYESLLLNETQFPKASQSNTEVEEWVEQVVSNWRMVCGAHWTDAELGEGGKESVGRGVLDILYRAATKTFHSTAILRDLFTVHAAIGEFDLAMHAFNSYTEIVSKGKARAEKTGQHEIGFDDDNTAMLTAVEAVRICCRYGDRDQAEKAVEIGKNIQKWLVQQRPGSSEQAKSNSDDNRAEDARPSSQPTESQLRPKTVAAAHRAIGISQAHWARLTYETDVRPELQQEALKHLRQAYAHDQDNIETSYALALLLAETREVAAAVQVLRSALSQSEKSDGVVDVNDYSRQRKLVPLWHLLAQCLTAQDQYEVAAKMCEAAFEQFGESAVLLGQTVPHSASDPEKRASSMRLSQGVVDQMEGFEKEGIIQIKMTQLTFTELMEGPSAAVDMSDELLGLYTKLFGSPEQPKEPLKPPPTAASTIPSKTGGTLRSIAGSIRPKSARNSVEKDGVHQPSSPTVRMSAESNDRTAAANGQAMGAPISITVTNENGVPADKAQRGRHEHKHNHHLPFKLRHHHGDHNDAGNLRSTSADGRREKASTADDDKPPPPPPKDTAAVDHAPRSRPASAAVNYSGNDGAPASPEQPLGHMSHNRAHDEWPSPAGHGEQPPRQDVRLPAPHPATYAAPEPSFPSVQQRRHKVTLLVGIWLFIAGLYQRAELLDDASGAVDEAYKLVDSFEAEVAPEDPSARGLFFKGWGGGKGVDELWADVWSARGDLATARQRPFKAMSHYEQALTYLPDHTDGIIGLSDLLMDIYEEKIPAEEPRPLLQPVPSTSGSMINAPALNARLNTPGLQASLPEASDPAAAPTQAPASASARRRRKDPSPAELNRLTCRDRAYMLLSNLTRLGTGWDCSEAWYTLARAHELSHQVTRAKQALWWVVELEEAKPMRPWHEVAAGGFTL